MPQTDDASNVPPTLERLPQQGEFVFPSAGASADAPLVLARMVNEYQYCPRLAYLEWMQGGLIEASASPGAGMVDARFPPVNSGGLIL